MNILTITMAACIFGSVQGGLDSIRLLFSDSDRIYEYKSDHPIFQASKIFKSAFNEESDVVIPSTKTTFDIF